jgi:hypothetical protein
VNVKPRNKKFYILTIPFFAALIFWFFIYSYTFLQGDDYRFSINGGSLPKIWIQYLEYYTYGGARMGNLLAGLFLMVDMRVWKVTTAIAASAVSVLFFYYVRGPFKSDRVPDRREMILACVCAVFPGLLPMSSQLFSDSFLWLDGSANYLYPFLLMLVGFLPFYSRLRNRPLPKIFLWISPPCFVAAVLLHEQITMMLFCMGISALFYLKKAGMKSPFYLKILVIMNAAALVLMLTAPGAYFRMKQENGTQQSILANFVKNFKNYFVPLVNDYCPWLIAMGLAAILLLRNRPNCKKAGGFIQLYLCFGVLLTPLSWSLHFPMLQLQETLHLQSRFQQSAETLLTLYWLLYLLLIFAALLIIAHENTSSEKINFFYLPVLYVGMWGSQVIPAFSTSCCGRARMPLYAFVLLMIFCILWDSGRSVRWAGLLQISMVLIGIVSFACIARGTVINGIAAAKIQQQIFEAQHGERNTVLVDYNQFDWTFYNATFNLKPDKSPHGYEAAMRKYYNLPETVEFKYTKANTGCGAKIYLP